MFLYKVAIGDGTTRGIINVYNESLGLIKSFKAHTNSIPHIKQSPFNNGYIATVSNDFEAKIWNSNWDLIQTYTGHTRNVYAIEFVDTYTMASGSNDLTIKIWSLCTGTTIRTIYTGAQGLCLLMLNDGVSLAAGFNDIGSINIYNVNTGALTMALNGHVGFVSNLQLISNSNLFASSGHDFKVRIWNLTTYECKFTLTGHSGDIYALKLISQDLLASGSNDLTIKIWNVTSGSLVRTITGLTYYIYWSLDTLINTNDGSESLIGGLYDQTLKMWSYKTGQLMKTINTGLTIYSMTVLKPTLTGIKKSIFYISQAFFSGFECQLKL